MSLSDWWGEFKLRRFQARVLKMMTEPPRLSRSSDRELTQLVFPGDASELRSLGEAAHLKRMVVNEIMLPNTFAALGGHKALVGKAFDYKGGISPHGAVADALGLAGWLKKTVRFGEGARQLAELESAVLLFQQSGHRILEGAPKKDGPWLVRAPDVLLRILGSEGYAALSEQPAPPGEVHLALKVSTEQLGAWFESFELTEDLYSALAQLDNWRPCNALSSSQLQIIDEYWEPLIDSGVLWCSEGG